MIKIVLAALLIDLLIGDPVYPFHPIRLMGKLISFEEKKFLKEDMSDYEKFVAGSAVVVFNLIFSYLITYFIIKIIPAGIFRTLFKIYVVYSCISLKELSKCARKVREKLEVSIVDARHELSMIVGRDTENLTEKQIVMATVETVAENASDGVFSPLIFAFLFGPAGAIMMKMANTMDSMIGYDDSKYLYFGKTAALTDDVINFIPARLTASFFILAGAVLDLNIQNGVEVTIRDSKKHASLNAGFPESAMAGLLGVKLLGPSTYHGVLSDKPFIGNDLREINRDDIFLANRVMYVATALLTATMSILLYSPLYVAL